MGQHKHNPTAIAAKEGNLPPKTAEHNEDERLDALPTGLKKKAALLASTMAAIASITGGGYNDV